jgi:GT2 family glycosyltransferase/glycosyltransferase involved in cell wall biosynthesis
MGTLAVLIASHNRRERTLTCLNSVFAQQFPAGLNVDVLLVDDGSSDGTSDAVRQRFPEVRLLQGDGNLFWTGGMRLAFGEALKGSFDYYLWLNDDVNLYLDALKRLVSLSEALGDEAIVVGATQDAETGAHTYGGVRHASRWHPLKFASVLPGREPREAETMNGNCVLIPAHVARMVGDLRANFTHGISDFDYGLRARRLGIRIWVAAGYVGTCSWNKSEGTWADPTLSLAERWSKVRDPKGLPPKQWAAFAHLHAGWAWPLWSVTPYVRLLLSALGFNFPQEDSRNAILLVTCPVDLGSGTLAENLKQLFRTQLSVHIYPFAPKCRKRFKNWRLEWWFDIGHRMLSAIGLWRAIWVSRRLGRRIVLQGITPAVYAAPLLSRKDCYVFTDWTKKLYEPILGVRLSPFWVTKIHSVVLQRCAGAAAFTQAAANSLERDYGLDPERIQKIPLPISPFPSKEFDQAVSLPIRLLFLGGDLKRKGGDILLEWLRKSMRSDFLLTMVTRSEVEYKDERLTVLQKTSHGDPSYYRAFSEADLFVLPTRFDAYPIALGEALAAGLALLATKNALGAPEVIVNGLNGFVCETSEALLERLEWLLSHPSEVAKMKRASREIAERKFSLDLVFERARTLLALDTDDLHNCHEVPKEERST